LKNSYKVKLKNRKEDFTMNKEYGKTLLEQAK